jgi:hypothetical protein
MRGGSVIKSAGVIEVRGLGVGVGDRDSMGVFDDLLGGEWEREGMGGGLEERLVALLGAAGAGVVGPNVNVNAIVTPVR